MVSPPSRGTLQVEILFEPASEGALNYKNLVFGKSFVLKVESVCLVQLDASQPSRSLSNN